VNPSGFHAGNASFTKIKVGGISSGSVVAIAPELQSALRLRYYSPVIILVKQANSPFKWGHFEPSLILSCVRWYCRYQLSYRDVEEMMRESGLDVNHLRAFRWEKLMRGEHRRLPFSISVDKDAAYSEAFSTSQVEKIVPQD
jgi:hypothetical protein